MLPLKLNLVIKTHKVRKKLIEKSILVKIIEYEGSYVAEVELKDIEGFENGIRLVPLTEDSLSCKGNSTIYLKDKDKNGYIKIIRSSSDVIFDEPRVYTPFRPGRYVRGNLIVSSDNTLRFKILEYLNKTYYDN